jgi:hypothetical protein
MRDSLEEYVTASSGRLLRFAYVLCGDRFLAEDLVQDVSTVSIGTCVTRFSLTLTRRRTDLARSMPYAPGPAVYGVQRIAGTAVPRRVGDAASSTRRQLIRWHQHVASYNMMWQKEDACVTNVDPGHPRVACPGPAQGWPGCPAGSARRSHSLRVIAPRGHSDPRCPRPSRRCPEGVPG